MVPEFLGPIGWTAYLAPKFPKNSQNPAELRSRVYRDESALEPIPYHRRPISSRVWRRMSGNRIDQNAVKPRRLLVKSPGGRELIVRFRLPISVDENRVVQTHLVISL